MTLIEVAYVTKTKLVDGLTISGDHVASLDGLEILDDGMLCGAVGFGRDLSTARLELAARLSLKTVTNTGTQRPRTEYPLPKVTS